MLFVQVTFLTVKCKKCLGQVCPLFLYVLKKILKCIAIFKKFKSYCLSVSIKVKKKFGMKLKDMSMCFLYIIFMKC